MTGFPHSLIEQMRSATRVTSSEYGQGVSERFQRWLLYAVIAVVGLLAVMGLGVVVDTIQRR